MRYNRNANAISSTYLKCTDSKTAIKIICSTCDFNFWILPHLSFSSNIPVICITFVQDKEEDFKVWGLLKEEKKGGLLLPISNK